MKTTLERIRIVGNSFVCQTGIESLRIKKTFQYGGGVLGGCLKVGDIIKVTSACNDIDTVSFSTDITLHRLSEAYFYNEQYFRRVDIKQQPL
jgi:hypothetical protein